MKLSDEVTPLTAEKTYENDCVDALARARLESHSRQIIENGQRITVLERLMERLAQAFETPRPKRP